MSKKKKKKDGPKPFFSKKRKRQLFRMIFIAVILSAAYVWYQPEVIEDPQLRLKVLTLKAQSLDMINNSQLQILSNSSNFSKLANIKTLLPQGEILGKNDVYVETAFQDVSQKLKTLPEEQYLRIKREFCSDVINTPPSASASSGL